MNSIKYRSAVYLNPLFVAVLRLVSPIILLFLRTRIAYVEGFVPEKGPLLIAAHHEELADQYIIAAQIRRRLFWLADTTPFGKSLADNKFMSWLMLRIGAIPIDKKNSARNENLFRYLLFLLKKGEAIVFFPEAYLRSERKNMKFGRFKDGVVRLALLYEREYHKKIPIYPVGIRYVSVGCLRKAYLKIGKAIFASKSSKKVFSEIRKLS